RLDRALDEIEVQAGRDGQAAYGPAQVLGPELGEQAIKGEVADEVAGVRGGAHRAAGGLDRLHHLRDRSGGAHHAGAGGQDAGLAPEAAVDVGAAAADAVLR